MKKLERDVKLNKKKKKVTEKLKARELSGIFSQKSGNFERQVYELQKISRIMAKAISSCLDFMIII